MTVTAIIVSWDEPEMTARAVASLRGQTMAPDRILVVDNHPEHPTLDFESITTHATVIASAENTGFAGGAALGIRASDSEWVFLLNPDAVAAADCLERLLDVARPGVGLIGAQILLPDGRVNAGDNPVHLTGITWAGGYGEPRETGPARQVASVSGAAMLVRHAAYDGVGGLAEDYFLYHEDVELCWRMRIAGWDVLYEPAATVTHDYEFDRGTRKWFFLERNRARTVLACYSRSALVLLAPLLAVAELAASAQAVRGGWWREKRAAFRATWRDRHAIAARRRAIQHTRRRSDAEIIRLMTATFDTPVLAAPAVRACSPLLRGYRGLVLRILERTETTLMSPER